MVSVRRWTDRRYQPYYFLCFAVDNEDRRLIVFNSLIKTRTFQKSRSIKNLEILKEIKHVLLAEAQLRRLHSAFVWVYGALCI